MSYNPDRQTNSETQMGFAQNVTLGLITIF